MRFVLSGIHEDEAPPESEEKGEIKMRGRRPRVKQGESFKDW